MFETPYTKCDFDTVYEPSEDSFLLIDSLEYDYSWLNHRFQDTAPIVLEIGCGSGIVTTFMVNNNIPGPDSLYFPLDINPWALDSTHKTLQLNNCDNMLTLPVRMNLTNGFKNRQCDVLVFNPPYVPSEIVPNIPSKPDNTYQWLELALLGGNDGMDVTWNILNNLSTILSQNGVAYILFCARNKPMSVVKLMESKNFIVELVKHRKAGWEILSVYKFYRKE